MKAACYYNSSGLACVLVCVCILFKKLQIILILVFRCNFYNTGKQNYIMLLDLGFDVCRRTLFKKLFWTILEKQFGLRCHSVSVLTAESLTILFYCPEKVT